MQLVANFRCLLEDQGTSKKKNDNNKWLRDKINICGGIYLLVVSLWASWDIYLRPVTNFMYDYIDQDNPVLI